MRSIGRSNAYSNVVVFHIGSNVITPVWIKTRINACYTVNRRVRNVRLRVYVGYVVTLNYPEGLFNCTSEV